MNSGIEYQTGNPAQTFSRYVDLCNRVMTENQDSLWFRQAIQLNEALWNGRNFRVIVYDRDPGSVIESFTVRLDMDKPEIRLVQDGHAHDVAFSWKTPLSYLEEVVAEPERYIAQPMLLDWEWLKERVRDEASYRADGKSIVTGFALGVATAVIAGRIVGRKRVGRSPNR
ncbi:MAG: hypothetical protein KY410_07995 [Proteobacteria bacterium]|nr:hypothetical protein [Pseudomonadota bacterium]